MTAAAKPVEWKISQGLTGYLPARRAMEEHVGAILAGEAAEKIWLLEHPPLYTAGTSAKSSDLLGSMPFPVYDAGRGGQYTYHGPGQRVAYAMLDLKTRGRMDVRAYVQSLEHWLIATLKHFGVEGFVREGRVGVWIKDGAESEKKIAAIGIRIRKWVTYHGISLNVHPDLSHYGGIVPCGLSNYGVTSLAVLGVDASMAEVDEVLRKEFGRIF